ncbi:MAG: hypothetical protein RIE73_21825 [Coleofasciculus sp. C1-SOL-03]|uniref:hypothetical protein n=1 Tax=Coleofasciculus sp. C1-SOL-03 TaxID=3069522 RepID=UPI0032F4E105
MRDRTTATNPLIYTHFCSNCTLGQFSSGSIAVLPYPRFAATGEFDQFRHAGYTSPAPTTNGQPSEDRTLDAYHSRISFDFGVSKLRKYLNGWRLAQLTHTYTVDYLLELENLYKKIFPGRSFAGLEAMPGVDTPTPEDYYFLISDGNRTYDITEMSGGEQSIFPILYEFVQKQIAYSVVLAAHLIADYSAARIALSQSAIKKPKQLRNYWHSTTGRKHPFPDSLTEADCYAGIRSCVQDYNRIQTVSEEDVLTTFQQILPTCRSGGVRFQHYLTFFSGKDLLCGMERVGARFIRGTAWDFCNVLVERIANSKEDIWNWLPEWQQLRNLVIQRFAL